MTSTDPARDADLKALRNVAQGSGAIWKLGDNIETAIRLARSARDERDQALAKIAALESELWDRRVQRDESNRRALAAEAKASALEADLAALRGAVLAMRAWLQRNAEWGGGVVEPENVNQRGLKWSDAVNWIDHLNSPEGRKVVETELVTLLHTEVITRDDYAALDRLATETGGEIRERTAEALAQPPEAWYPTTTPDLRAVGAEWEQRVNEVFIAWQQDTGVHLDSEQYEIARDALRYGYTIGSEAATDPAREEGE